MFQPYRIIINGQSIQLGDNLPNPITSVEIQCPPGIVIHPQQAPLIRRWLRTLIDNCTATYIMYNGTLLPVSEMK